MKYHSIPQESGAMSFTRPHRTYNTSMRFYKLHSFSLNFKTSILFHKIPLGSTHVFAGSYRTYYGSMRFYKSHSFSLDNKTSIFLYKIPQDTTQVSCLFQDHTGPVRLLRNFTITIHSFHWSTNSIIVFPKDYK